MNSFISFKGTVFPITHVYSLTGATFTFPAMLKRDSATFMVSRCHLRNLMVPTI